MELSFAFEVEMGTVLLYLKLKWELLLQQVLICQVFCAPEITSLVH